MNKKRLLIITDAWTPQVNGVVMTLAQTRKECEKQGFYVDMLTPDSFRHSFPCPFYKSIRLAVPKKSTIENKLRLHHPDYIHIATEGPIGIAAAKILKSKRIPYTTSYHTKFPEYVNMRIPFIKKKTVYEFLYRKVHNDSHKILVTTKSMKEELSHNGFPSDKLEIWGRGIDTKKFSFKESPNSFKTLLYVGRISKEKDVEAFLRSFSDSPFNLRIVGDGPDLEKLKRKYSKYLNVTFVGEKTGQSLVSEYHSADIFVFPSKSDTFGIVQLEAMACGLPVAAFNVTGPKDVIVNGVNGYTSADLHEAVSKCQYIDSKTCSDSVQHLTWESVTSTFIDTLTPVNRDHWY